MCLEDIHKHWLIKNIKAHQWNHYHAVGAAVYLSFRLDDLYQFEITSNRGKAHAEDIAKAVAIALNIIGDAKL